MTSKLQFFNVEAKKAFFLTLSFAFASFAMAQTKVTGTLIGTAGSYGNVAANTKEAAVDGNINTFFDGPVSASYVGYDLGVNNQVSLSSVKFFPRNTNLTTLPDRMKGNRIYGSNVGYQGTSGDLLYTFPDADTGAHLPGQYDYRAVAAGTTLAEMTFTASANYRYVYMYSNNSCNVGEIEFWGTSSVLGLDDLAIQKNELKVYPNPSKEKSFDIDLGKGFTKSTAQVKIFSVLGNLVFEKMVNVDTETVTINHNLNAGIYIVKVDESTVKLIVQ